MAYILKLNGQNVKQVFVVGEHNWEPQQLEYVKIKNASSDLNTIYFNRLNVGSSGDIALLVSTDNGETWKQKTSSVAGTELAVLDYGREILIKRPIQASSFSTSNYQYSITSDYGVDVSGDLRTLVYGDAAMSFDVAPPSYAFKELFFNGKVVDASGLYWGNKNANYTPASNLFSGAFYGNTLLQKPMFTSNFGGAVGSYAFYTMYDGCTSLAITPKFGNITSVGQYGMHYMMKNTAITKPLQLSFVSSAGVSAFEYLYSGCTSLDTGSNITRIQISENTSTFCRYMYDGCSSLTTVYAPTLTSGSYWNTDGFVDWMNNVPASGTMYMSQSTYDEITVGTNGIPSGWTKTII